MMEVETKPLWEFKEEVEIMEEEEDTAGALHTRERKKMLLDHGHEDGGGDELKAAEEEADGVIEEEHQSVFFDPTKVSDLINEVSATYAITEVMQFGAEKENANETSSPKGKQLEAHENVNAQEITHSSSNGEIENGSLSNGSYEVSNSNETMAIANGLMTIDKSNFMTISNGRIGTTNVDAIEVEKDEHVTEGKLNIEEYDLEKIIDEQETHDLYCPNCKSCITRRVILKKRKRTARPTIGDEQPKKLHTAEPSPDTPSQTEPERHGHESPDIFRCLSCFSFFIPTGCGFNIFRVFGRTDVNQDFQIQNPSASREMPQSENCGSWLFSCFQTGDGPTEPDADPAKAPLLGDAQSSSYTTTAAAASTTSVHCHGTMVKPEHPGKPLPAESSSQSQTTTTTTTTTTSSVNTSSHTSSATGFIQSEETQVVTGQQVEVHNYEIHRPKPAGEAVTDATHLPHKEDVEGTTMTVTDNSLYFGQPIPTPGFSQITSATVVSEGIIQSGDKPTSLIPPAVGPAAPPHITLPIISGDTTTETPAATRSYQRDEWDILKAVVYGGLVESVTSLSIVSAAAASGAKTLDIFILGIANLIGGLPLIFHNITDLRNCGDVDGNDERVGHYWLQLGRSSKFRLHMVLALLSYIMFGLLPPVLYGLSFRKSDNRENKMMTVAAASLACIALLALGKAHVKRPRTYFKTLMYYLTLGVSSSGLSYVAGELITRLLVQFGLIDQGASAPPAPGLSFPYAMGEQTSAWASY